MIGIEGVAATIRVALVSETYPPEINGVAMTLARLVGGLRRQGHRVQIIRPRQRNEPVHRPPPDVEEVLTRGWPIPGYPYLRFGVPAWRLLHRLWSDRRPDVVHVATEGPLGSSAVAVARRLGIPIVSGFHTNFHLYSRHYGLGWLGWLIAGHLRRLHRRTDLTLAPNRDLADELREDGYGEVALLARGVDGELFHPGRRSQQLRRNWGVGDDGLVVAYVGRIAAEKNIDLAVRAFSAIGQRSPDARMLFVGDGPLAAGLARSRPHFIFAGPRRGVDLATHYASADLFLFPSLTETYGNVVPEAMASGLAVVAFDCAAAADLIRDGRNGRVVAAGNDDAFIAAAVRTAIDPASRHRFRQRATAAVADLDWERIHQRYSQLLWRVIRSRQEHGHAQPIVQPD